MRPNSITFLNFRCIKYHNFKAKIRDFNLKLPQKTMKWQFFDQFRRENSNISNFSPLELVNFDTKIKIDHFSSFPSICSFWTRKWNFDTLCPLVMTYEGHDDNHAATTHKPRIAKKWVIITCKFFPGRWSQNQGLFKECRRKGRSDPKTNKS